MVEARLEVLDRPIEVGDGPFDHGQASVHDGLDALVDSLVDLFAQARIK